MYIDPALLGPVSALMGALIGGSTSLAAAEVRSERDAGRATELVSGVILPI